jgi:hypothetical protein
MGTDREAQDPPPASDSGAKTAPSSAKTAPWDGKYFVHVPHPHVAHRKDEGPIKVKDQMDRHNPVSRLNSRIALFITLSVGSMWAAYLFILLALVSFPAALQTGEKIIIVAWISQTFFQLVLLPIIIVGQNIQGEASDKRAQQTYNDAEAILHEALQIQDHLLAQDTRLQEIIESLTKAYPTATAGASGAVE